MVDYPTLLGLMSLVGMGTLVWAGGLFTGYLVLRRIISDGISSR